MKKSIFISISLLSLISCKSHKIIDKSYVASDTCSTQTHMQIQTHAEIQRADSISSNISQEHIEFQDQRGEIVILPSGRVKIKGIKSADLSHESLLRNSKEHISTSDSLCAHASQQSASDIRIASTDCSKALKSKELTVIGVIGLIVSLIYIIKNGKDK